MSTLSMVRKSIAATPPNGIVVDEYNSANFTTDSRWFFGNDGSSRLFSFSGHDSCVKAYTSCPPITSIINKKAQAHINGKTWVINTKGKAKGKEAKGEIADKLRKLLAQPNPLQTWKEFEAQQKIYIQLFGFCLLLPMKPYGFGNIDATSLWNIPPFMLDIEETKKLFYQSDVNGIINRIVLTYKGTKTTLQAKDVYIMKDFTPSFNSLIIPESRICSLEMAINNIIGAYESRNVLINYRGALGIISPDSSTQGMPIPLKEEDKTDLQTDFLRYGLKNKQWKFIISTAAVKWTQMGVATKDLMLFEEIDDDIMRICDQYNYPYRLLSSEKSNSLGGSDVRDFKKLLYQDAIMPEAESMYEQWNQFFGLAEFDLELQKDFSHIPALQQDQQTSATARKALNEAKQLEWSNNLITLNNWLEALGEDPLPGDEGNFRRSQIKDTNTPLAVTLGVGGTQAMIAVLTANISEEAKRNSLIILFGLSEFDAARMAASGNAGDALQTATGQNP